MLIYLDPTEGEKIQQGPRARGFWQLKDLKVQKNSGWEHFEKVGPSKIKFWVRTLWKSGSLKKSGWEKWVPEKTRVGKVGPCQFVCCGFKLGKPRVGREENLKM